jgi:hypothetical protein
MSTQGISIPDGLTAEDLKPERAALFLGLLPILVFALLIGVALAGVFGGGHARWQVAEGPGATLAVRMPERMRNGIYFEMRLAGIARLADVEWAILEPHGKISFIGRDGPSSTKQQDDEGEAI